MLLEVGVKAFIKNSKGQYLMLKRAHPYEGTDVCKWDIPGGRINPGERLLEALAREIKEETGMKLVDNPNLIFAQDILRVKGKHTVRITYIANAEGKITLDPNEHSEYAWMTIPEIEAVTYDIFLTPVLQLLI